MKAQNPARENEAHMFRTWSAKWGLGYRRFEGLGVIGLISGLRVDHELHHVDFQTQELGSREWSKLGRLVYF